MINSQAVRRWKLLGRQPTRPGATAGVPQDGKNETEMVGIQAGHETAHIFERPT
jgi:hypothetical protein